MRKKIIIAALLVTCTTAATGNPFSLSKNRNLNYRTPIVPQTHCFAPKGELKLYFSRQLYAPDTYWHRYYPFWERVGMTLSEFWLNSAHDPSVALSYTPTSNIALSISYIKAFRWDFFMLGTDIFNVEYDTHFDGTTESLAVSGAYHNSIAKNWEYEVGTSLLFGKGNFVFTEELPGLPLERSTLRYGMFTHNLKASLSYRYRKMQVTGQLNTGYVRYYNIDYSPVLPGTYEHIVSKFYNHQTDFYIDPALLVNFNFSRFGWQLHYSFPYALGESRISKPIFAIGIGVSFKILKGK